MAKDKTIVKQKKMGRPVTVGGEEFVGLRLPSVLLGVIDAYAVANGLKRSEAIRHLIELAIPNTATAKAKRAKAKQRSATQPPRSSAKTAPKPPKEIER